jgi:hypothetical protein
MCEKRIGHGCRSEAQGKPSLLGTEENVRICVVGHDCSLPAPHGFGVSDRNNSVQRVGRGSARRFRSAVPNR